MPITVDHARAQAAALEVVPMNAALAAEVRGIDLGHLDDATFASIRRAWLDHLLLVFRGQSIDAQGLVAFAKRFGTPVTSSNLHQRDLAERTANQVFNLPPEVTVVTNVQADGKPVGILGDGEVVWHSDFSFKERPTAARMLLAVELPPAGQGKGGHVLVVDDEPEVVTMLKEALMRDGHQVVTAPNGAAALEVLRTGRFEVVLCCF